MSTDSRTVWLNEAVVTLLTKLPPATPGTLRMRPPATSDPSASRTVGRLTPNSSASCVSGGSLSPGLNWPPRMASLICCSTWARGRVTCFAVNLESRLSMTILRARCQTTVSLTL